MGLVRQPAGLAFSEQEQVGARSTTYKVSQNRRLSNSWSAIFHFSG
jgi:hypothetical protein